MPNPSPNSLANLKGNEFKKGDTTDKAAAGRLGGIASGESKRRAKSFQEAAEIILNQLVDKKDKNGNVIDKITGYEAILLGQLDEAIRKHNTKAAKFIADITTPKRVEITGKDGAPLHVASTVDLAQVEELHKKIVEATNDNK